MSVSTGLFSYGFVVTYAHDAPVPLTTLRFGWDRARAASNLRRHGISSEVGTRVFVDPFARAEQDRVEDGERRWRTIGTADGVLPLVVARTVREESGADVIRVISARRAEPKERSRHERARAD